MRHVRLAQASALSPNVAISPHPESIDCIERAIGSVRSHLGMDVALVSEFVGDSRIFRHIDTKLGKAPVKVGDSLSLARGYCKKVVDGLLPELIPDTSKVAEARAIPETAEVPIGSHIGVPVRLRDGRLFGALCCFSFNADPTLNERDLGTMKAFAEVIGYQLDMNSAANNRRAETLARIRSILESERPDIVYQPVFRLSDMSILGAEALARFVGEPPRSPDKWFEEADEVGLKMELELKAIRNALDRFRLIAPNDALHLGVNASPNTIASEKFAAVIRDFPADRLILEITEHDHVENYGRLTMALSSLRRRGIKVAVDDAGSGYASMRHILNIHPDFIKLDVSLTRGIHTDRMKRALAKALIGFGQEAGCKIIAEGVEFEAEMEVLKELGVHAAQGYLLSHPVSVEDLRRVLGQAGQVSSDPASTSRSMNRRFGGASLLH